MNYDSGYKVYTIWWLSGSGWYTVPELPTAFRLVQSTGMFAIYQFDLT